MEYVLNLLKEPRGDWGLLGGEAPSPQEATILVVDFHTTVTDNFLAGFPNLRAIFSPTTGTDHLTFSKDIKLFTLRGDPRLSEVRSVCEYTFKLILGALRPEGQVGRTLAGKTMGVIGVGRIGRQVKSLAEDFHMSRVYLYDKRADELWRLADGRLTVFEKDLSKIFRESDIVTLHVDQNPTSIGMITQDLVNSMKPGAILINTARPAIVEDSVQDHPCYYSDFPEHVAGATEEDRKKTDDILISRGLEWLRNG